MRRALVALTVTLTLAACSPYDTPADAAPDLPITTSAVRSGPSMLYSAAICDRACWERIVARQHAERAWWAEVVRQQQARAAWARLTAHLAARSSSYPAGQCGGTLPPCYVMRRESGGNIRAQNPRSTASGKWQFLDSTWARYGGYAKARHAPESVQDAKARLLWAGGRGCSHWSAC